MFGWRFNLSERGLQIFYQTGSPSGVPYPLTVCRPLELFLADDPSFEAESDGIALGDGLAEGFLRDAMEAAWAMGFRPLRYGDADADPTAKMNLQEAIKALSEATSVRDRLAADLESERAAHMTTLRNHLDDMRDIAARMRPPQQVYMGSPMTPVSPPIRPLRDR